MLSLLIIDDHPLVGEGISRMLVDLNYLQVTGICKNAAEAISFLEKETADTIYWISVYRIWMDWSFAKSSGRKIKQLKS